MQLTIECPPEARSQIESFLRTLPNTRLVEPKSNIAETEAARQRFIEHLRNGKPLGFFNLEDITPEKWAESDALIEELFYGPLDQSPIPAHESID